MQILAAATARQEVCAVIDLCDSFHPASAAGAGVRLNKLVWVRCGGNAENAIRAADLLLHAGGFGVIILDLCGGNLKVLNRIPLSYWYRFRRAVADTPAILVLCADTAQAKSCSALQLDLAPKAFEWTGHKPFTLLRRLKSSALVRKSKLVRPEPLAFETGERVA
jgi:hypothetical protein